MRKGGKEREKEEEGRERKGPSTARSQLNKISDPPLLAFISS